MPISSIRRCGSARPTPLYIVLLHHAWRFTGDDALLKTHLDTAERCLRWIDDFGDMDGDGFQEYQRRTPEGAENQAWKDSGNGVLYENGDDVPAPKAVCELQGYVFDAWRRMAEVYDALGRPEDGTVLREKARRVYDRFNAVFWDETQGYYAFCLDPAKKRVMSIASNPGHLLWSGIVPPDRAARVVQRLMADDMWSGWGVRTLAASHAAYNPHDYQLGANVPQAWAAGSVFTLLHGMLGMGIDVPGQKLFLDPVLPDWLPEVVLEGVRVGKEAVDLRVWREGDETRSALSGSKQITLVTRPLGTGPDR